MIVALSDASLISFSLNRGSTAMLSSVRVLLVSYKWLRRNDVALLNFVAACRIVSLVFCAPSLLHRLMTCFNTIKVQPSEGYVSLERLRVAPLNEARISINATT